MYMTPESLLFSQLPLPRDAEEPTTARGARFPLHRASGWVSEIGTSEICGSHCASEAMAPAMLNKRAIVELAALDMVLERIYLGILDVDSERSCLGTLNMVSERSCLGTMDTIPTLSTSLGLVDAMEINQEMGD